MTAPRDLDELIRSRLAAGESVKGTARECGVTEWRVRCIARSETTRRVQRRKIDEVRLKPVKRTTGGMQRAIVFSDIHIPYHDHGALAVAMEFARSYVPNVIVLNGDILDFHEVSSHPKDAHALVTFEDELSEGRQFLRALRAAHPKATIYYTMGNHEDRLQRYLTNHAPELSSLAELALDRVLDLSAVRVAFVDARGKVALGPLEVFHGSIIRKGGGNSARGHMDRRGGSVLMGHTHRLAMVAKSDRWGTHWAIENGHLSDPDPTWCVDPDWQQGFTTVEFDDHRFAARLHHIAGGRLVVDGGAVSAG